MTCGLDRSRQLQRRLAAELDHDAVGLLALADGQHRLDVERLEVEAVGRVVVGRDRLRVAIDHHRLVAELRGTSARRGRSSSRTRCPGRCGSGRSRGSRPAWPSPAAALRPARPTSSSSSSTRPPPRRRTSRCAGRRVARLRWRCSSASTRPSSRANHGWRFSGAHSSAPSSPRFALTNASRNVRPMPIVSPTAFIWVPSVRSAPGNFSKAKRGIFTTT